MMKTLHREHFEQLLNDAAWALEEIKRLGGDTRGRWRVMDDLVYDMNRAIECGDFGDDFAEEQIKEIESLNDEIDELENEAETLRDKISDLEEKIEEFER